MKKEKPILFNSEMVQAILSNKKTQTRRMFTQKVLDGIDIGVQLGECFPLGHEKAKNDGYIKSYCPFGQIGDQLWVRETYTSGLATESGYAWKADFDAHKDLKEGSLGKVKWKPSIHMPRSACRIMLEITDVRYERLNDISEADAKAEGCDDSQSESAIAMGWYEKPVRSFKRLWGWVYGEESLKSDPWVWVIEFKVIQKEFVASNAEQEKTLA